MAIDNINSIQIEEPLSNDYTTPATNQKKLAYWKRTTALRHEPVFHRSEKDFWTRKYFFLYCMLLGNTIDGLPLSMRFALNMSGGFYLLLQILITFTFVMPIMYMEIFIGKYTGLTASQLFRMAPIFFGFVVLIFVANTIYCPMLSTDIALFLIGALELIINPEYGQDCPPNATSCYDFKTQPPFDGNCEYKFMSFVCNGMEYRYVSAYFYWSQFLDYGGNFSSWQILVTTVITWIIVLILIILGMKVLTIALKTTFVMTSIIYSIIFIMAISSRGSANGLMNLIEFRMKDLNMHQVVIVGFFSTMKMGLLTPNGYTTYAAYTIYKGKSNPGTESLLLTILNLVISIVMMIIMHAAAGSLAHVIGVGTHEVFAPFGGLYYAMIPEFLKMKDCPNIFIIFYHITNWLLEISKLALTTHMHIMYLNDAFPKLIKFQTYVKIGMVVFFLILSMFDCLEIFITILNKLYLECSIHFLQGLKLFLCSLMVFYTYGVSRLDDDIHFVTGRRPIKFWRIIWYMYPIITIVGLAVLLFQEVRNRYIEHATIVDMPRHYLVKNMLFVTLAIFCVYLAIALLGTFFYIVLGIRNSTAVMSLMKPLFHWGPPQKEARVERKKFAPRTAIRSQPPKKRKQRFRPKSIRQMHERDMAEHVKRGRIFLDSMFFTNVGHKKSRLNVVNVNERLDHPSIAIK